MAKLELKTKGLKGACIICSCSPVDEDKEGRPLLPMFHAVGVDVNWGEDCNICQVCAGVMADMMGRPDASDHAELDKLHTDAVIELDELREEFDEYKERVKKVVGGKRAEKELAA